MSFIKASVCLSLSVHRAYLAFVERDVFRTIMTRLRRPAVPLRRVASARARRTERRDDGVVERIPDQYLAWRDDPGGATCTAEFEPLSEHRARVTVCVTLPAQAVADAPEDEVQCALLDFKTQAERVGRERVAR